MIIEITRKIEADLQRVGKSLQTILSHNPSVLNNAINPRRVQNTLFERLRLKSLKELNDISRKCGVQIPSSTKESNQEGMRRKDFVMPRLIGRMTQSLLFLDQQSTVLSLDIGVKNMAFSVIDTEMRLHDIQLISLEDSAPFGSLSTNLLGDFAAVTTEFTEKYLKSRKLNTLYVIEQQMQRHNPRCLIVEAQIHALLYPHAISLSPLTVSNYLHLSGNERSGDTNLNISNSKRYAAKKKAGVNLVDSWVVSGAVLDPESPAFKREDCVLFQTDLKKKDDIADCILSGVVSVLQLKRLQVETLCLLEPLNLDPN